MEEQTVLTDGLMQPYFTALPFSLEANTTSYNNYTDQNEAIETLPCAESKVTSITKNTKNNSQKFTTNSL